MIITSLLERERRLRSQVGEQQRQLTELEALRAALTTVEVTSRPGLQLATAFLPAEGPVAGDFFLITAGPPARARRSSSAMSSDTIRRQPGRHLTSARHWLLLRRSRATRRSCCNWRTPPSWNGPAIRQSS